jgi:hypothetical protein
MAARQWTNDKTEGAKLLHLQATGRAPMACSSLARHVTSAHVSVCRSSATARSEADTDLTKTSSGRTDLVRGAVGGSKRRSLDGSEDIRYRSHATRQVK